MGEKWILRKRSSDDKKDAYLYKIINISSTKKNRFKEINWLKSKNIVLITGSKKKISMYNCVVLEKFKFKKQANIFFAQKKTGQHYMWNLGNIVCIFHNNHKKIYPFSQKIVSRNCHFQDLGSLLIFFIVEPTFLFLH